MKQFFIKFQLVIVSALLLVTFSLTYILVAKNTIRRDVTQEKLYSLSEDTKALLQRMDQGLLEILAFYPADDAARANFEIFLKECKLVHSNLRYQFYDPDRSPRLARELKVSEIYTVVLRTAGRQENVVAPSEESFANALLRLADPRVYEVCFTTGHEEAALSREERNGLKLFRNEIERMNIKVSEIILGRDQVPAACHAVIIAGPHHDFDAAEFESLREAFRRGKGILFLIDPMDPGEGILFINFLREFGVTVGEDVIVDKMSRRVGGDFLVPLVSQYINQHPVTEKFDQPTFFPVARSVNPSSESTFPGEVMPLAMTGPSSWSEKNLALLERGEAIFEPESDVAGPIPVAVSVEEKAANTGSQSSVEQNGRLIVVGDSDFVTNGYLNLSGNKDLALNMIQWLLKDDRFISIHMPQTEFVPLFLTLSQRLAIPLGFALFYPLLFLLLGGARIHFRKRAR